MKLAIVYNPNDNKLLSSAYSWTYRDMFLAILERFAPVLHVTEACEATSIEADAILFYDVHSSHHIEIEGIEKHPAVKLEYFNDPHQKEQAGTYRSTGQKFHKLGPEQRCKRAIKRGVRYIICPYKNGYEKYIKPCAGDIELIWSPIAPKNRIERPLPLSIREAASVAGTGHLWQGENGFRPYEFRNWAYKQPQITYLEHGINSRTPKGIYYQAFLSRFAGAAAFCDCYVVPKYLEIPMAGCVCFCQMRDEYTRMGFADGVNCIAVNKENFNERVKEFLADPCKYQSIADAGRKQALNYTADKFADKLYEFLVSII